MVEGAASTSIEAAQRVGEAVAGPAAADVDRRARFPTEAVEALRAARLLAAAVPTEFGGAGCDLTELVGIAQTLGRSCASTAMIWAMHQVQVACIVRHGLPEPYFQAYLGELAARQLLIASVTSEVGVGGDIRTSLAAVEREGSSCRLEKHGSTVSYGAHADDFLTTVRRAPDAAPGDQVLVLHGGVDTEIERSGAWDTLGMRGTCSPPFRVTARFGAEQILPEPFARICAVTMVPYSHLLWSACWLGIATDAVQRTRRYVRARARGSAAQAGGDSRLAEPSSLLQQMRATVERSAKEYDDLLRRGDAGLAALESLGFAIRMNQLKLGASELVVRIVGQALAILGMAGYRADGPYSVERHLRDAYSAPCMIGNERLRAANATMLLVDSGMEMAADYR